jgi:pantoate--beta-alanine ligase
MVIFEKIDEMQKHLQAIKQKGLTVGFVPTMGALHKGHISLVKRSLKETGATVVSIFVNPTQFNNPDDLKKYPRTPEKDLEMLRAAGADIVFMPSVDEMYPPDKIAHSNPPLPWRGVRGEAVMEGLHRPGHFKGVVEIVSKFFEIIKPDKAYFGEKDFQQLFIIRELVKEKNYTVKIIGCTTLRESNGVAMSSRNMRLTDEERKEAGKIFYALSFIRDNRSSMTVEEAKQKAKSIIESNGTMKIEYLEIADEATLQPVAEWNSAPKLRCFIAAHLGTVRLMDNMLID